MRRDEALQTLRQAFDAVCTGHTALLLVQGYAGSGKTALIQELYRPIVRQRGYCIAGKCDRVVRGVPFGALMQAIGHGPIRQRSACCNPCAPATRSTVCSSSGPIAILQWTPCIHSYVP